MDGLGPQSLPLHGSFCVWEGGGGGAGISEVVRLHLCVRAFVRACCMLRLQLPPLTVTITIRPSFFFFASSPPPANTHPPIPKVNLFTVILKGELFAVIVRTDEGQALRGGPACP